jgi:hypothetical protein
VPLSETDQNSLLVLFGLDRFSFVYLEKTGSQTVRSWKVTGSEIVEAAYPLEEENAELSLPVLVRTHLPRQLTESPAFARGGLWETWLPFPFHTWGCAPTVEFAPQTRSDNADWWNSCVHARTAFEKFQERLFSAEISVVHFTGDTHPGLTLFFHSVRKRFLTAGKLVPLEGKSGSAFPHFEKMAAGYQKFEFHFPQKASLPEQLVEVIQQLLAETPESWARPIERPGSGVSTPFPL